MIKWFQDFMAQHPQVAVALAALLAAIFEALTGVVNATGGVVPGG